jgi:hypothetical protein
MGMQVLSHGGIVAKHFVTSLNRKHDAAGVKFVSQLLIKDVQTMTQENSSLTKSNKNA